ncbi:MAG: aminomethyl transferase family protein [Lentisphaerae bacterium]|nr:aminomethyl transferase family protein [Lentisphaerota bacterium]
MAQGTFFAEIHQELNAKMAPAGKWQLPLFYPGGSVAEHRHTRSGASIFDMTGCRIFQIAGKNAPVILDKLFTLPTAALPAGGVMENVLLHENGTFAVIFTLCRMQAEDFMLITPRGTAEKEIAYLLEKTGKELQTRELSEAMAVLTLAGKNSGGILLEAGAAALPEAGMWQMQTISDDEDEKLRCIVIRHDRFGECGFDICCSAALALEVYGALYRINGAEPAGMTAWESLRIESGTPDVPSELHGEAYPQECGLARFIDFTREFTGKAGLQKADISRKLAVVKLDRHPALPGSPVSLPGGCVAGTVSSGAFCPVAGAAQVICTLDIDCPVPVGAQLECIAAGKSVTGTVIGEVQR